MISSSQQRLAYDIPFRDLIDDVVNLVNGKVLAQVHSSKTDGYATAESSLFVFASHLVWKVWGQSALLPAVRSIVELAGHYCGLDTVDVRDSSRAMIRWNIGFHSLANLLQPPQVPSS